VKESFAEWHLTLIKPREYQWTPGFDPLIQMVAFGLMALGYRVSYQENNLRRDAQNVVFAAHLLSDANREVLRNLPVIVYNFEQIPTQLSAWPGYDGILRTYPVWEYNRRQVDWMHQHWGMRPTYVPVGYVPVWTRIPSNSEKDIDFLFFGSLTSRRTVIVKQLQEAGYQVVSVMGAYGITLDGLIARSRVVLNIHQYSANDPLEIARLAYLWANRCAVVSETATEVVADGWVEAAAWATYDELTDICRDVISNPDQIRRLREAGYFTFRSRPFVESLRHVLNNNIINK